MLQMLLALVAQHVALADCRNGNFSHDNKVFGLARVTGAPRTHFRADTGPCPDETPDCRLKAYVVPGDILLLGDSEGDYVCALFPNRGGGSAGYVRRSELAPAPAHDLALAEWQGRWRDGDNSLVLSITAGMLAVQGEAFWPSADPPLDVAPAGPYLGQVDGRARPQGRTITVRDKNDNTCEIRATLLPPFLVVDDNLDCGGMNVSFRGVYRRQLR